MDVLDRNGRLVTRFVVDVDPAEAKAALGMLSALKLRVDKWQPKTRYNRAELALKWSSIARLGQDIKDIELARNMNLESRVFDSDGYTLRQGKMTDPYTGKPLVFNQVNNKNDRQIDLDHVVALADAFVSGGYRWTQGGYSWTNLYNDPGNLLAVATQTNQQKGSKHAGLWLPRPEFCRRFVIMQIQIKSRYHLSVTESEAATMVRILS
ncbi:MAG: HNH endonuclease family protein [Propionibacteriaceae bacterium]|nr:HNH endonuclease family protein [Propionibacteriaceae bacterium]